MDLGIFWPVIFGYFGLMLFMQVMAHGSGKLQAWATIVLAGIVVYNTSDDLAMLVMIGVVLLALFYVVRARRASKLRQAQAELWRAEHARGEEELRDIMDAEYEEVHDPALEHKAQRLDVKTKTIGYDKRRFKRSGRR